MLFWDKLEEVGFGALDFLENTTISARQEVQDTLQIPIIWVKAG